MNGIIIFFAICFVVGFLSLLFGKKMINGLLAVYAFVFAYRFIYQNFSNYDYVLYIALACGILAIVLMRSIKKFAFFLLGAYVGYLLSGTIMSFIPISDMRMHYAVLIGIIVVCGVLVMNFDNVLIRYATSFVGGELIGASALFLIMENDKIMSFVSGDIMASCMSMSHYLFAEFMPSQALIIFCIALVGMFIGANYQRHH